jgi:hypothetical protein
VRGALLTYKLICAGVFSVAIAGSRIWSLVPQAFRRSRAFSDFDEDVLLALLMLLALVVAPLILIEWGFALWLCNNKTLEYSTTLKSHPRVSARSRRFLLHLPITVRFFLTASALCGVVNVLFVVPPISRQRQAIDAIEAEGAKVGVRGGRLDPLRWPLDGRRSMQGVAEADVSLVGFEFTDDRLARISSRMASLDCASGLLIEGTRVTDDGLATVSGVHRLQGLGVVGLGTKHANFIGVDPKSWRVTDRGLEHLKGLAEIEYLWLDDTRVTDAGLKNLAGFIKLRSLALRSSPIDGAGLEHLTGLKCLTSLDVAGSKITDAGLASIGELVSLEFLNLSDTEITDAGLVYLNKMKSLKHLNLAGTKLSGVGLTHLAGLSALRTLDLDRTQMTDAGLAHLPGSTRLWSLSMRQTRVSDAGLEHLHRLTNLWCLNLDDTQVSGRGLMSLEDSLGLTSLSLDGTPLDDAGLEAVSRLNPLHSLRLNRTRVTDAGLAWLGGLTRLRYVELAGTAVSESGAAKLHNGTRALCVRR